MIATETVTVSSNENAFVNGAGGRGGEERRRKEHMAAHAAAAATDGALPSETPFGMFSIVASPSAIRYFRDSDFWGQGTVDKFIRCEGGVSVTKSPVCTFFTLPVRSLKGQLLENRKKETTVSATMSFDTSLANNGKSKFI